MRPSQVIERAREKAEEVAEKKGEVTSKGWIRAKGLGKSLKKELLCVHRKREGKKCLARGVHDAIEEEGNELWLGMISELVNSCF